MGKKALVVLLLLKHGSLFKVLDFVKKCMILLGSAYVHSRWWPCRVSNVSRQEEKEGESEHISTYRNRGFEALLGSC